MWSRAQLKGRAKATFKTKLLEMYSDQPVADTDCRAFTDLLRTLYQVVKESK